MLRSLLRLALTIVTIVVCAGIASPGRWSFGAFAFALEGASSFEGASADREVVSTESSHHCHDGVSRPSVDLKAIETDDDDDDPLFDVFAAAPLAFVCLPGPRRPDSASRGALPIDTSRFEAGTGLPRGPPA